MDYHTNEARDLAISTLALGFAFTNLFGSAASGFGDLAVLFVAMTALVGVSFVGHELAHRTIARKFGATAVYQMWPIGVILAVLVSLLGFIIAAPGAVVISESKARWRGTAMGIGRTESGIISLSGPAFNLALASLSMFLLTFTGLAWFSFAARINIFLALFNLLPIPPLDGSKVLTWDVKVWVIAFAIAIISFRLVG